MPRKKPTTYHEYRQAGWKRQGEGNVYQFVSFGNNAMKDGSPINDVYLEPRPHDNYKDIWHCPSQAEARRVAREILQFGDVYTLNYDRKYVWVKFDPPRPYPDGYDWRLPGQWIDDRSKYRGL